MSVSLFTDGPSLRRRGLGPMMVGSTPGRRERRKDDFYPTPWEGTAALISAESARLQGGRVWECACGNGAMSRELAIAGLDVFSSDLIDRGFGQTGTDFLQSANIAGADKIITNPPFVHAARFIRHALEDLEVPYLALLLKVSFWNAGNRVSLFRRHPPTALLPLAFRIDFTGEGASTMDLMWVIWDAHATGQRYEPLTKPVRRLAAVGDLFEAAA